MKKTTGFYPRVKVDTSVSGAVGQAGGVLLTETVAATGLGRELSVALAPWRRPLSVHDRAKVITDLAVTLALGGDCLADVGLLRAEPGVYGPVASDPTISRTIATLVTAHSDKEHAVPTFKRGFGFHPLCTFVDHGPEGTGEPLAIWLRPGNTGSNTATDHIAVIKDALAQLPRHRPGSWAGRKVLVRTDGAGATHKLLDWMSGRRLSYSVGFTLPENTPDLPAKIPKDVWTEAYDAHDAVRDGAWVAELTGLLDLTGWPKGMRVIVRKERPHPGAQLPDLELRHRRRPRCEDRIRIAKDTDLAAFPPHGFAANKIWCAIIALALDPTACMQTLTLHGHQARRWEPKRLRLRLSTIPASLARTARRVLLHLAAKAPWADLARHAVLRLRALAVPG